MSTNPVLYLDFDGVVNWFASRNKYNKHDDTPHRMARGSVYVDDQGGWYSLNWSQELVFKLNTLKDDTGFHWVWHTTWLHHTSKVDALLKTKSDRYLDWDADGGMPFNSVARGLLRDKRKYVALKADVATHNSPFVWVDDTATKLFNADDFTVPHLVITPDELYGMTRTDLNAVTDFMKTHSR